MHQFVFRHRALKTSADVSQYNPRMRNELHHVPFRHNARKYTVELYGLTVLNTLPQEMRGKTEIACFKIVLKQVI